MPAVDQPHLNDPLELRRNTIARNTALAAIVISAFSTLAYAVSGIVQDDVRSLILMSTSLLFTIAALIALLWIQRGKITRGIWILVLTSSIAFSVPTFLYETIGLIQGPLFLMLVGLFVPQTVAERKPRAQMIITGFAISTLNVLIDAFWPYERPVASASAWGVRIVLFLAILVYVLILSRQLRNVNLRTKITIFFAAVSLLAILVISAINISTTRTILLSTAQENLETAAANLANELDNWIVTSLTGIRAEAQNPLFVKALMSPSAESVRQDALQALIALRNKNPIFIEAYSLLDSTGKIYLSTDLAEIGLSEANRDYFLSALQQGLPTLSLWYVENRFYLANPIRDPDNKVIGVLRARYSASLFQQFVAQAKGLGGEGSFAILVDNNLVILAHGQYPHLIFKSIVPLDAQVLQRWQEEGRFWPGEATSFSLDLFDVARQLNEGRTSFLATDAYGTQQQGAIQQLKQQPWKVVFVQPRSILIRPVLQQIRQSFLTSALILILTFYAAYSLSRVITMPVTRLTETARQITQGHLEYQAEVSSNDEIGQLAQAFNLMTAQLRDLVNTLEQRVQERTR
ncbi:MAG: cache domain-containing protein, partial [Anaerolineales bacterium]|nr:cache domain-containing protein [Anaerolineales bacterium]